MLLQNALCWRTYSYLVKPGKATQPTVPNAAGKIVKVLTLCVHAEFIQSPVHGFRSRLLCILELIGGAIKETRTAHVVDPQLLQDPSRAA